MNTRIASAALVGIIGFLGARVNAQITVSTPVNGGLNEPYAVVVDATNNFYVTDSADNCIVRFDANTRAETTLAGIPSDAPGSNDGTPDQAHFNNPQGLLAVTIGGVNGLLVADSGNNLIRFVCLTNGVVTTLAGQTAGGPAVDAAGLNATFHTPIGLDQDSNGNVYIADWGNDAIRVMNLADPAFGVTNLAISGTSFYRPTAVAFAGPNQLWVADTGNQMIKLITLATPTSGSFSSYIGGNRVRGTNDAPFGPNARFDGPAGLLWVNGMGLLISDTLNNSIRLATNNPAYGVTNYAVVTFAGASGEGDGGSADGMAAAARFNSPFGLVKENWNTSFLVADLKNNAIRLIQDGLPKPQAPVILGVLTNYGQVSLFWSVSRDATSYNVKRSTSNGGPYTTIGSTSATNYTDQTVINGTTYYYVVSAIGAGGEGPNSAQVTATPPLPPVSDPQIGWVDFPATATPIPYTSVFHPVSSYVANNEVMIVIEGEAGSQTFYTYGATSTTNGIPDPTSTNSSARVGYEDGLSYGQAAVYSVAQIMPDVTYKAIGEKSDGSPNSAVVSARFQFVTGNPVVNGDNAAQFTVSDITTNAEIWYTTDGSEPTNAAPSVGPIPGGTTLSLQFPAGSNAFSFRAIAFRDHFQPSGIVSVLFSATNFVANTISFGFASGEASSDFVGSPGQNFYAPVTLQPLPNVDIYSLQFNLTVTNAGGNPGPAVMPNAFNFKSLLKKPIPGTDPVLYEPIPPLSFAAYASNPPPADQIVMYDGSPFLNMVITNTSLNLLGIGWLERFGMTNLYDTRIQQLISYSIAHDTLFTPASGKVVLGGYAFQIPLSASAGQTYQIQIGRPSATSDGIGEPGFDVYIATPTNGSLAGGSINAVKVVTVGQRKYVVGDCAPFRWFNAGDFGNTNLDNSDVEQVFQSAIYSLDDPPANSDFFDSMDSCG
ncbi:MAG TPA: chitobiase/beta-hexosaminidase C-terminal domain-containing protein, partial [Candidatus Acidoferrum sp.]|nr:chitobiase/beta-hexosaminidase C-terminal domain-containing protein [Candidatus Acidoferrum sp.]